MPSFDPRTFEQEALQLRERYEAMDALDIEPLDVTTPTAQNNPLVDVANILFGDEMATVGISLDNDGFRWSMERARDFWVEHPVRAGLATALSVLPAAGLLTKGYRRGRALSIGDDVLRRTGMIDDTVDFASISERTQELLRGNFDRYARYKDRIERIEQLGEAAPLKDRAFAQLHRLFNNKYMEELDPSNAFDARAQWVKTTSQLLADQGFLSRHLRDLPPDDIGPLTARFFMDPSRINEIPSKYREWAVRAADDLRATQASALEEGFISPSEAEHIGDIWFNTSQGRARRVTDDALSTVIDVGGSGEARILRIPRTSSVNLLNRRRTRGEVDNIVTKQAAADLLGRGRRQDAIQILNRPGYEDARRLAETGDTRQAIRLLTQEAALDLRPQSIVFDSIFQQKMLLENYRMLRDVALNPDVTKGSQYVSGLNAVAKSRWLNLDTLPGSDRIRRMVAVRKGVDSVEELGWVPKGLYKELEEVAGGSQAKSSGDFLQLLTSIHKTSACVTAGHRILTENGYIKIEDAYDYKDGFNDVSEGSPRVITPTGKLELPIKSYRTETDSVIQVTLKDGTTITGTPNHPILTTNGMTCLDELTIGDVIPDAKSTMFPGEYQSVSWNPFKSSSSGISQIQIDKDLAELLGWFIGDGSVHWGRNSKHEYPYIRITMGEADKEHTKNRLAELCERLGIPWRFTMTHAARPEYNCREVYDFQISNSAFGRLLVALGAVDFSTYKKHLRVPEAIFRSPRSVVSAFLSGLFDADGYVCTDRNCTILTSVSKQLASDVHLLLKWLGCRAYLKYVRKSGTKYIRDRQVNTQAAWAVRVGDIKSCRILYEDGLFSLPRKRQTLSNICTRIRKKQKGRTKNRVASIERINEPTTVYDVSLGDPHKFISEHLVNGNTAFNAPTHFQNIIGNYGFLVNAGVNPLSREFIDLQKRSLRAIRTVQKEYRAGQSLSEAKNLGTIPSLVGGRSINIAEEMASVELRDLTELSSVLSAEGIGIFDRLGNADNFTGALARAINQGLRKTKGYIATDAYVAEDAVPKMAYFLKLRQEGLSRKAALLEVGKRLPMYHSVGQMMQGSRKWLLPWVTFPAEAARILKNNLMDHPLKTAMMLQMPKLAQVGIYSGAKAMGNPMSYQDIQARKDQLATWAYRPTTVISPLTDDNSDIRAATLDFLPFSSVMPPTLSDQASAREKLPFGTDDPMPILGGLYMAMTGRDPFGREVPTDPNSPTQRVRLLASSLFDFLAPPFASKYILNPRDPDAGYRLLQDLGRNVNPYTEKPGDPVFDFIINNLSPVKMFPASPEQQLANEEFTNSRITAYRSRLTRDWTALLKSGDTEGAAEIMRDIMATFSSQWSDPAVAQAKMSEYLRRHATNITRHPQLRGFSREEIIYRINELEQGAAETRSRARRELIQTLQNELRTRGRSSQGGSRNPFVPLALGAGTPTVLQQGILR